MLFRFLLPDFFFGSSSVNAGAPIDADVEVKGATCALDIASMACVAVIPVLICRLETVALALVAITSRESVGESAEIPEEERENALALFRCAVF